MVPRRRLAAVLDGALDNSSDPPPIALVCAPAGSGKTTLLADWARTVSEQSVVVWVTVGDATDPRPLGGLIARSLEGTEHGGPQQFPESVQSPAELLAGAGGRVWIVLDDAHHLQHPDALSELETLIRTAPRNVRIVVCGRFEPPLALQKLRLDGRIVDVTFDDLAFTSDEAEILLAEHDVRLAADDLSALMSRTEGWAAGLRLAGMSLENHPDPARLIEEFTGCRRAVADYLIEQLLDDLPVRTRDFLVKTSVPATFTVGLAEQLTGDTDAHTIVEQLEHRNFLIGRIEGSPTRFRYHPLLRSYLRAEIGRLGRDAVTELEHVAARWYAQFGEALLSLEHAVAADDAADVTFVLQESGLALVLDGHAAAVERLLAGASATVREQPITRIVRSAAHLHAGTAPMAAELLDDVPSGTTPEAGGGYTEAFASAVRLHLAVDHGQVPAALEQDATIRLSGDPTLASYRSLQRGRARLQLGLLDHAEKNLRHALACARAGGSVGTERRALVEQAVLHLCRGELTAAHACVTAAGETASDQRVPEDDRRAALADALGSYLRNDLSRAVEMASASIDTVHGPGDPSAWESTFAAALYRIDVAENRRAAVTALHSIASTAPQPARPPGLVAVTLPSTLFAYLHVGETTWGREWADSATALLGRTGDTVLLEAILCLGAGHLDRARTVLRPVLDGDLGCAAATSLVTAWLVDAEIARRRGHDSRAHDSLAEALRAAEPEQILRPFHDLTQSTRELLSASAGRFGSLDAFAGSVRDSLPRVPATTAENLTRRELELLAELPTWRTAEEIASDLCVSINTVKTHLRGIYRKLGVSTRREAVLAAQSSGLL
ncbi:LuxR C-terminal-related transcriptional regulator [Prescottella sp. R16]|uniref:LuxR C-terminal-related transcriptional regulator n=1 Tax=Prescottella sp. R16 TaxID=3064529 RepID=UPI00272ED4C8|nr:LuxR C-terminal-related transcriptional regulator [Prescottella sp. R16]